MRNVGKVTFETLLTNLTIKHLFLLIFFILLNPTHVFFDVKLLLPADQQTFGIAHIDHFGLGLSHLLLVAFFEMELLPPPVVHLRYNSVLHFLLAGHLL